ncbi:MULTISPECIES: bifunctional transaldolase/phosoglucose isomerase [Rhodomicrobium]|uniref:bifunctional transaldolase/phosoglucose isomerase n=1 Tax=Rhodomicrobium TaxID=1068 RepID=UPI000B4BBBC0|nr:MULTISPECIES: bifunctional transaldolase/phosoglucose isomerase [Rhodomicrobium]
MNAQPEVPTVSPLKLLRDYGQAVWLDFLARCFVEEGGLAKLIEQDGLTGVTSNPSIFEKAIGDSTDYDDALKAAARLADGYGMSLYEGFAIEDIQHAADALRQVYDATNRQDGYVSFEVSPYLALDTEATITEARRLWTAVGRENLMVKVPATKQGLPAIRQLLGEGINVNITLLFSQAVYEEVVEAYLAGLEHFVTHGGDASKIASVASFFISRIDVEVDKRIEERLRQTNEAETRDGLTALRGKVAIANAKLAYQRYKRLFAGPRWEALRSGGARVQRLLWASTGTKNKDYSDVLYVETLIAPDTVNTLPPATMDAFRDHGKVAPTLEADIDQAEQVMAALDRFGISIDAVGARLVEEGVQQFGDAFDKLLGAVARKRAANLGDKLDGQSYKLPPALEKVVAASLEQWRHDGDIRRLWAGDASLWTGADEAKWLGWLTIVDEQRKEIGALKRLAEYVRQQDFSHVVLLGMGGSSLGAEVFARTFGRQNGWPELLVLDSTDPAQIRTIESRIDPARTLFIVSSKSGSTLEPNILKQYFFESVKRAVGADKAGARFIAITDPGSALQKVAGRDGFHQVAFGVPGIGGRYSVLSNFGLVPAATMGVDVARLVDRTDLMVRSCAADVPAPDNPGVVLGTILGVLGKSGRDKVTIIASPAIADFGAWLEQLLAESTGKQGKGLIPVDAEPLGAPDVYGEDRLFVYIGLSGEADANQEAAVDALEAAGQPVVRIGVTDRYHLGQEFFRWEMATAVAGAILGIDPFDQPDVEASKIKTRELTEAYEKTGALPPETPFLREGGITLFADEKGRRIFAGAKTLADVLKTHFGQLRAGDYCALLAYVERSQQHIDTLQAIRVLIRDKSHTATCLGFGPRFLHSTGQAYKGGPNSGVFLQITCDDSADLQVPGQEYTFGVVKAAEARGDLEVLAERDRRVLRVHLGSDVAAGLAALDKAVRQALA